MSEDLNKFCFQIPELTICDVCMTSDSFKHHHTLFCRIDSEGNHNNAVRAGEGVVNIKKLEFEDFKTIPEDYILSSTNNMCLACLCPSDSDDPPVDLSEVPAHLLLKRGA